MAPSGKVVFSSGIGLDFDIWSLSVESGALKQLTHGESLNDFPRWSPDGKAVAYVSTQEDSIPSLWVMDANGGEKRRLTQDVFVTHPSWSPDGRNILFVGNAQDRSELDICAVPPAGGPAATVCSYPGVESSPSFSPDSRYLIFSAPAAPKEGIAPSGTDTDIISYDLKLRIFSTLDSHPARDYHPAFSPDGSQVAFISHREHRTPQDFAAAFRQHAEALMGRDNAAARAAITRLREFEGSGDIFLMRPNGGALRQLTSGAHAGRSLCWSPCGQYLMFSSAPHGDVRAERLRVVDVASGGDMGFRYDRSDLEREIGADRALNSTVIQRLVPDVVERLFISGSFFGEERNPHWSR